MSLIAAYIEEVQNLLAAMPEAAIRSTIDAVVETWRRSRRIYVFGNGGSAATASHFAVDLGKGTRLPGRLPFKVTALTDNVPLITAWGNDASYDDVFLEQLRDVIEPGDVAIGISTSGQSTNVLKAMPLARDAGALTVGFIGFDGGRLKDVVDIAVIAPGRDVSQCEDAHHVLQHLICSVLRKDLSGKG